MQKYHSVLVVILLLLFSSFLVFIPFDELSFLGNVSAAAPPAIEDATTFWNDNWTVNSDATYRNQTIILNGNLTVTNGNTLTLINTTIMMNCTLANGQYHIDVLNGGTLEIFDYDGDNSTTSDVSLITDSPYDVDDGSGTDYAYNFSVNWGGMLEIRNSSVRDCGWSSANDWEQGISVYGHNTIFDHVDISNRFKGIVVNNADNVRISNCTIRINASAIDAYGLHAYDGTGLIAQNNTVTMTGTGADQVGIYLIDMTFSSITGNNVTMTSSNGWGDGIAISGGTGNRVIENAVYQYIDGSGIILWYTNTATVAFNKVVSNSNWCTSIYSEDSPNSIIYENNAILNTNGVGIYLDGDCQNIVVFNNSILGNADSVNGIYIFWAYNNFTIINTTITLIGSNSYGLHCESSSYFSVYGLNVTLSDQFSVGIEFWNCHNITVIGANISSSSAATGSDCVWIEDAQDIFILDLKVDLQHDFGSGLLFLDGAESIIIIQADVMSTSSTSQPLEGSDCDSVILINSTLNAPSTDDVYLDQDAMVTLLNCTFSDRSINGALTQLIVGWYLNVQVLNSVGNPFPGVNVVVEQSDTSVTYSGVTDSNGWVKWIPCLGYIQNSSVIDNSSNPYTINASNATCWDLAVADLTNSGQIVKITLANDDPIITNTGSNIQVLEDTVVTRDFDVSDKENNPIIWSIDTTLVWVEINASTGLLKLSPSDSHVGNYNFVIRATDIDGGYDEFNIAVNVINRAPVLLTVNELFATEDSPYLVDFDTDDDPATTWTIVNIPSWLSFEPTTAVLSGTPTNAHVGAWDIELSVEDGHGGITWNNFTLTVNNTQLVILTNNLPTVVEDKLYFIDYASSDDGEGSITWQMTQGPGWLYIDPVSGVLSGRPNNAHVGQWTITVEVNDNNGGTDQRTFTILVLNAPPEILTTDVLSVNEDSKYEVDYTSSDDGQGAIIWSLATAAAGWLNIDSATGVLSGTPRNAHVGSYWVNVSVEDDHNGRSSHNFTLTVNNTNDAPIITTQDVLTATEDQLYFVKYKAADDDKDNIVWSLTTEATWLTLGPATGELSGTPTNLDVGIWEVTVACADGNGGTASQFFNLTVINVNDAPIIIYHLPLETYPTVEEGTSLDFNVTYTDEDSDIFIVTWTLDGLSVRSDVPFWDYLPDFGTAGDHEIIINITDDGGASASHRWIVIVTPANRPPIIDDYAPMNLKPVVNSDTSEKTFSISASDPDSNQLTQEWFVNGVDTGVRTSSFTFDRSKYKSGSYNLTVKVTDSEGASTEQTWTVDVKPGKNEGSSWTIALGILLIIIIIVIIILFILIKKKKEPVAIIEDIFLISDNGILLAHKSKELRPDMDDDIISGMLTAIQDFVGDAFADKSKSNLRRLDFGDSEIHLKRGKGFYLAVVLSGTGEEPTDLEDKLDKTIEKIEAEYGTVLENWKGHYRDVRGIKDYLDELLKLDH